MGILRLVLLICIGDLKSPREAVSKIVAGAGLKSLAVMHQGLDGIGGFRAGELFLFRLSSLYHRNSKLLFTKIRVNVEHTLSFFHRLLGGGVHGVTLLPVKLHGAEEGARGFFPANHGAPLIIQLGQIPPGVNNIFVMVAEQRLRGGTDAEPLGKLLLAAVGHPGHLRSEALHVVLFLLKQALGDKQRHRHVFVTKLFKLMV